jgi:hypothetical protein
MGDRSLLAVPVGAPAIAENEGRERLDGSEQLYISEALELGFARTSKYSSEKFQGLPVGSGTHPVIRLSAKLAHRI